jgi:energy-coupling factor transporter ATP-binding protein EcfA2
VIKRLRLENFKGVVEGEVELDKLTILVGPNNSGKTTILEALFLAPNPFRQVPYVPETAVHLLLEYHKTLFEKGYTFLLNKYIAKNMLIKVDERELLFTKDPGPGIAVYTSYFPVGYSSFIRRIKEKNYIYLGYLHPDSRIECEPNVLNILIADNTLLLSTKLVKFAHEYLQRMWIEILNTKVPALISKEVSRFVSEEYVNITAEPFMADSMTLYVMLDDGTRIRLSDLGAGVHLYIINRLLYEHYRPDVVLWDDLETHFNPRFLSHIVEWFADLVEEGKQVIVSTHSLEVVEKIISYVNDSTVLLTSLRDGKLRARRVKPDELEEWAKAGIDPRYAEVFLL